MLEFWQHRSFWGNTFQIRRAETDLLLLVGLGVSENVEDFIHIQFPGLAQLLQPDGLREGGGAVLAFHGFQQVRLFLFGQIGQFNGGRRAILPSSTMDRIPGIRLVKRIYRCTCRPLSTSENISLDLWPTCPQVFP